MTLAKKAAVKKPAAAVKKPAATTTFPYDALYCAQRSDADAPTFLVFHAPAADIAKWADVDRLSVENKTGAQRPLRELKVTKVAKFLAVDTRNTIPTAVVIAIDKEAATFIPGAKGTCGRLDLTLSANGPKPGLIIDGQHRVFGALKFAASTQLNVIGVLGGDDAERAFQFVVINNSATKVAKDHIKSLNLQYDQSKLNKRLISSAGVSMGVSDDKYEDLALLDSSPPFKGLIEWPTNKAGFIAANALEGALAETKDRAHLLGIEGLETDVFLQIWAKIHDLRKKLWTAPPKGLGTQPGTSRLLMKVSIYALTVYLLDSMVAKLRTADDPVDYTDVETLDALVERIVSRIPEEFWTTEWTAKELDTASGRKIVLDALSVIDSNARYGRTWYDGVGIIDPALVHGQTYGTKAKKPVAKKAKR
jgi:DGQHR domain-containing protein